MAFLEVTGLKKRFGNTSVLHGVDFTMEKGEVLAIIGSSGSGKTTLLRCINFLETPNIGQMTVNGDPVLEEMDCFVRPSEDELRRRRLHFGLVFQSFNLFPQYTAKENLMLAAKLQMMERLKAERKHRDRALVIEETERLSAQADEILSRMGLSAKADSYPCQLSGGQCQRVAN